MRSRLACHCLYKQFQKLIYRSSLHSPYKCNDGENTSFALKACSRLRDLDTGRIIHKHICDFLQGENPDIYISSSLINMYAKCGSMIEAHHVFNKTKGYKVDTTVWNTLLLGYADNGDSEHVFTLFYHMQHNGFTPDARTFLATLKACTNMLEKENGIITGGKLAKLDSLQKGIHYHSQANAAGCGENVFVMNSLVDFYAKCGNLEDAKRLFDELPYPVLAAWNSLILGYAENNEEEYALNIFSGKACVPDSRSFVAVLKACISLAAKDKVKSLEKGVHLHNEAVQRGFDTDIYVASNLVSMYCKCGSLSDAWRVFWNTPKKDVVCWTSLIMGLTDNGEAKQALELFYNMEYEPDSLAFLAALKACTFLAENEVGPVKMDSLEKGMCIHSRLVQVNRDYNLDVYVASSLVDMYANCGSLFDARRIFDSMLCYNLVSWNSLLLGYADNGEANLCLELFFSQRNLVPDAVTYVAVLKACANLAQEEQGLRVNGRLVKVNSLDKGMHVHSRMLCDDDILGMFVSNALVDMYAKCGSMEDARRIFDTMELHNMVSKASLLFGYSENGESNLVLELLQDWQLLSSMDALTLLAAVNACAELAALEPGKSFHVEINRAGYTSDTILMNSLVDFYCKCANMAIAEHVFNSLVAKTVVTWNSLMSGYTRQGEIRSVFRLFHEMLQCGQRPYGPSFVCLLTACSHAGLVDQGRKYFEEMSTKYGIEPGGDHYDCLVDILARANRIEDAMEVIRNMPFDATAVTWRTVLSACDKWKNVVAGKMAFERLVEIEGGDSAGYTLMGNIYGGH